MAKKEEIKEKTEEKEEKDFITTLVDFFEKIAEKYGPLDEEDQAEFREIVFGAENSRNDGPMYDETAEAMVEEEEETEPED